ncbi:hypothetical protein T484DRAFT_1757809 [Baffinella frigidus]|nr:hypothetical protein T484DRAFT_1757809 [Cryptophyta sp. CCMP2293]
MGEYLPYVNVDCADKANAELQTVWAVSTPNACTGVGLEIAPKEPPAVCGSTLTTSIKTSVQMPITEAQFTEAIRAKFITTVAYLIGVSESQVLITNIIETEGRRRLLASSIQVEMTIVAREGDTLPPGTEFTTEKMNAYITSTDSGLPTATIGLIVRDETTVGTPPGIASNVASSYAQATISLEFDSITFMGYTTSKYTYRIDNLVILNFLGLNNKQFGRIKAKISDATGFNVAKNTGEVHFTLTPDFGPDNLCPEVGDTLGLNTGHMQCFWRRAIVKNVVQPVASESLYFYRERTTAEATNAKAWIRDTILGGDSTYNTATASAHFANSCSRSSDPLSEARSYGCLFIDPGYRWSRLGTAGGAATSSPFAISDKTIMVAIMTIADEEGVTLRRRLLSTVDGVEHAFDLDQEGVIDMSVDTPTATTAENTGVARRLLQEEDGVATVAKTIGSSVLEVQIPGVNAAMNLAYISGHKNHRWQQIHIMAMRHQDITLQIFAGNTNNAMGKMAALVGPLVRSIHPVGFETEPILTPTTRRLLQNTGFSAVDVTAMLELSNSFGDIFTSALQCVMSALATEPTLLSDDNITTLTTGCADSRLATTTPVSATEVKLSIAIALSTCARDMLQLKQGECNVLRGVLALIPGGIAWDDWNYVLHHKPSIYFDLDLDIPYTEVMTNNLVNDHMRSTIADVLNIAVDRVVVQFKEATWSATNARRLLQAPAIGTRASVWAYKDSRGDFAPDPFNSMESVELIQHFGSAGGWWSKIHMYLSATPALWFRTAQNPGLRTIGIRSPQIPAELPWVVIVETTIAIPGLTRNEKSTIFMLILDSITKIYTVTSDVVNLVDMRTNSSATVMEVGIRFSTESGARTAMQSIQSAQPDIHTKIMEHIQLSTDSVVGAINASQIIAYVKSDIIDARTGSINTPPLTTPTTPPPTPDKATSVVTIVLAVCIPIICIIVFVVIFRRRTTKSNTPTTTNMSLMQTLTNHITNFNTEPVIDSIRDDSDSLLLLIKKTKIDPALNARYGNMIPL